MAAGATATFGAGSSAEGFFADGGDGGGYGDLRVVASRCIGDERSVVNKQGTVIDRFGVTFELF